MAKTIMVGSLVCAALFLAACGDSVGNPEVVTPPEADAAAEAAPDAAADAPVTSDVSGPDKHATVTFIAPDPRGEGTIKFAAMVKYPAFANKPNVEWADPFPGCVAAFATDNALTCDFGPAYSGTKIYFLTGVGDNTLTGGISAHAFSQIDAQGVVTTVGTYEAAVSGSVVGSFKDGKYGGALKASDETPKTANQLFVVP